MTISGTDQPIRDAAAVILVRETADGPAVLMGQRGADAAFMPDKYVFPGGRTDPSDAESDAEMTFGSALNPTCARRLAIAAGPDMPRILPAAAIRELAEETGLLLGSVDRLHPAGSHQPPAAPALQADVSPLRFIFRAITPPGRSRRFDARFFLANAAAVAGDLDDFSRASGELSHLHWVPLIAARKLNLPFITEIVLAEVAHLAAIPGPPPSVPFFDNSGARPAFRWID